MNESIRIRIHVQNAQFIAVKQIALANENLLKQIQSLAKICIYSLLAAGKIIFAGNGASFADTQHPSSEFVSQFMLDRAPLASIALGVNNSTLSVIGNNY
jgi:D-sedoheptulose 7-phosphate isomerase